jgi:tRNA pseudouridine13 synthase
MNESPTYPYALGGPLASARLRSQPEDFIVEEILPFVPSGEGEHHYLFIEKRNCNTQDLARAVAEAAGVPPRQVGYAGMKDKNAVTRQWFSVQLPGRPQTQWSAALSDRFAVLEHCLHRNKLRRGVLSGNRFDITVRDIAANIDDIDARLEQIRYGGVPNLFGEQRFGHGGGNIQLAQDYFEKRIKLSRFKRGIALSAARAWLFNAVLAARVQQGTWNRALAGDVMILQGSRRFFVTEEIDEDIERRVEEQDIHPSGSLWGSGDLPSWGEVAALEQRMADQMPVLRQGLERAGLEQERRALRVCVSELQWHHEAGTLRVQFSLPAGAYATSALRELIRW